MTILTSTAPFVDLRAWAGGGGAAPGDDYEAGRRLLDLPEGPVTIGSIALVAGAGSVPPLTAHEFVIVLSGAVTFIQDGEAIRVEEKRSIVLPFGTAFDWRTEAPARLLFMRYAADPVAGAAITPIDEQAALSPSGAPLAELLVSPTPQCRNHTDYSSPDGTFVCGTWDSTPYERLPMYFRHYELMHLLDGAVTIGEEGGPTHTFTKGDIFVVVQGARCSWLSEVHVKKVYSIYRPAAE